MLGSKKSSKLSRSNGQSINQPKAEAATSLDDSMDDFVVVRPLRAERKSARVKELLVKDSVSQKDEVSLEDAEGSKTFDSTSESTVSDLGQSSGDSTAVLVCPLCTRTFRSVELKDKHVPKCAQSKNVDDKTLQAAKELQDRQIAERISLGLPLAPARKTSERTRYRNGSNRVVDPSDLSLAIAMSESLLSANEEARRKEEELLITENLAEVIPDLRQEGMTAVTLAHIFQKPEEAPPVKAKRKPRGQKNRDPSSYTLLMRSQNERERLIADRAASILSQPSTELQTPLTTKSSFINLEPVSEFIKQYSKSETHLWQRASLSDTDADDHFYVFCLRSVLSPPKKKTGYTNILLHASQLPGRNSSQINCSSMMSTQAVLEELALGADGGFMDDSKTADNQDTSPDISSASAVKLVEDWSHFVNNPLLSDVTIQVADGEKKIHTHRLVLAARCPNLLEHLIEESAQVGRFTLDWREFTASSVLRVLRYIYTSRYEDDTEDAPSVQRIALRYHLTDLLDIISSRHHDLVPFLSDEDEEEIVEDKLEAAAIPSPRKSLHAEQLDSSSIDVGKTLSGPEKIVDMDISASRCVSPPASNVPPSSPDMFAESTYFVDSDEEDEEAPSKEKIPPSSPSDIIDLTQEDRSPSYVGSCEDGFDLDTEMVSHDHFDGDVSMVDGSGVQRKSSFEIQSASPPFTNETSILNDSKVPQNSIEKTKTPVASYSRSSLSFTNEPSISDDSRVPHHSFEKTFEEIESPVASRSRGSLASANELSILNDSKLPDNSFENIKSPVASCSRASPPFADESIPSWNDWNAYPSPLNASNHYRVEDAEKSPVPILATRHDEVKFDDEMEEELNLSRSSFRCQVIPELADASPPPVDEMNTPEAPRLAKKRKIEVTPLPDYQTMDTPFLKKELDKYGLKPLKRKNAVKLLHHIYEELHPLVTDSETSFQEDTPERGPGKQIAEESPEKSQDDASSQASQCEDDFDEEAALEGMDQEVAGSSQAPKSRIPVKDLMPEFFKKRPDIYQKILTYEPISFEILFKEVRQGGYRCKAADLLDWLDEQSITSRMKDRNKNRSKKDKESANSPPKKSPAKGRRVVKKLIA